MRGLFILLWAAAIFILTCDSSFNSLIETGEIRFQWDPGPNFSQFLYPLPSELSDRVLLQKLGHSLVFFILAVLLQVRFPSKGIVLFLGVFYSALTEILQLYFTRGGRLFDIGFDAAGILLALGITRLFTTYSNDTHL